MDIVPSLYVRFRDTRSGRAELQYAAKLAARMNGTRLAVLVPVATVISDETVRRRLTERLEAIGLSAGAFGFQPEDRPLTDISHGGIAIGNILVTPARDAALMPYDQTEPCANGKRMRILLPFAGGPSGLRAAEMAARLGRSLSDAEFVLYHTTWRNRSISSDVPALHMREEVENRRSRIESELRVIGPHQARIELAIDVVSGIVNAALQTDADLIVMSRGRSTVRGSYVDRVLARSTVPVLVAAKEGSAP